MNQISASSSSGTSKDLAILPASRCALIASTSSSSFASVLSILACLEIFAILLSRISISEKISSRLMVSISLAGSIDPSTWIILVSSKQRTTCTIASTSRMFARNWFPRPSPLLAPFTSPAISTNSMVAGVTFLV